MSLRLLLDEDTQAKRLIRLLREAGHDVWTATEAGLIHKPDSEVMAEAAREARLVVTRNCDDFNALHRAAADPPGILAIYQNGTESDLSDADIVRALTNLEAVCVETGWTLGGRFIALNPWKYGSGAEQPSG